MKRKRTDEENIHHAAVMVAKETIKETNGAKRYIKSLRKLGASNREIALALSIPEDAPILQV